MDWFTDDLDDCRQRGVYRRRRKMASAQGPRVRVGGRELINFSGNDYLNLAADPRLVRAAAWAARRYGCGAGASPLISGYSPPLRALERSLADWQQCEAALVFSSGFAANLAVLGSLAAGQTTVFSDALNHASLIDGCRLARARVAVYRHGDVNHLEDLLTREGPDRRRLIVTDSVFSMDGDFAPLTELLELATRHGCLLVVDEAHATGVLGPQGRGLLSAVTSERSRDNVVKIGTLSKALGTQGGFVCGSKRLIDWLVNHARPYIFSTALAPPLAAAARRAVGLVRAEPQRRQQLLQLAERLREQLAELGIPSANSRCQIVPLLVGAPRVALRLSRRLEEEGLLLPAIRPPSVPTGGSRLRISLSAGHSREDLDRLLVALRKETTHLGQARRLS